MAGSLPVCLVNFRLAYRNDHLVPLAIDVVAEGVDCAWHFRNMRSRQVRIIVLILR